MESNTIQDTGSSSLPMIVWLCGDEEEFSLTAEDVMATLDIKRSRLTQISGRELRVGRRRVDRYLKPFYRPVDVHSYQEQTRAALTRQRSAAAVSSVAADIEARHKTMLQATTTQMTAAITAVSQTLQRTLNTLLLETQAKTNLAITEQNFLQTQKILPNFENLARQLRSLLVECEQLATATQDNVVQQLLAVLRTQHEQHQQVLAQLLARIEAQCEEFARSATAHTGQLLALQQSSAEINQQEQEWQALYALLGQEVGKLTQLLTKIVLPDLQRLRTTSAVPPPPRVWASVWW